MNEIEQRLSQIEARMAELERQHREDLNRYRKIQIGDEYTVQHLYEQVQALRREMEELKR